jgi:antitoxin (DNA-binding transcriptional repressor) of toxin-antitoxin stability system
MHSRVLHISEEEAAKDFRTVLERVSSGHEVVIDRGGEPIAVIGPARPVARTLSECIALARKHEQESGTAPVMDPDFAADVEDIINNRRPWNPPPWE